METPLTIEISQRRTSVRGMPRLSRSAGFWAVAFSFFVLTAFSTAPSSLYGLYEQREHLSSVTITFVYAVYAVGVVVSRLLAAHVSDWYGRRAVLLRRSRSPSRQRPYSRSGLSMPVVGLGIALQHVTPRMTLLAFALIVGLGILAAAPVLVRPPREGSQP